MTIRATYRIQFNRDFTFADAEGIVPYLTELGISHLYASPITTAQPGSTHGYDVIDPTRVNPELGGEEGLRRLVATLKAHELGLIIDIVPNHMGVAGDTNPYWQDVLEKGEASDFARWFDINWSEKLLLPFLGTPLPQAITNGDLKLRHHDRKLAVVAYESTSYPIRAEDYEAVLSEGPGNFTGDRLADLLDRQHYRLGWWRAANDDLHWRRFFTISELAGLRIEDKVVFEAVHALPFRLFQEGLIDGVRVDHVDGLSDPAAYCRKLRERLGPAAYIVIEKILAHDEPLAEDWGTDGTTGYDFMEEVSALLHSPEGEPALTALWTGLSGRPGDFAEEELRARQDMLGWEFEGQLTACVKAFKALAASAPGTVGLTEGMVRRAIERMLWVFPVYRTYGIGSAAPASDERVRKRVRDRASALAAPGEAQVIDAILAWLAGTGPGDPTLAADAVRRFQQLSAPIAAKAVEDTAFYRYGRLLSRVDVGFDPARLSMKVAEFHQRMAERARAWPRAMLATATHDHKRGEDVRARLAVLSEIADEWAERARAWIGAAGAAGVDAADTYQLLQTLVGAWPDGLGADQPEALTGFRDRVAAWQEKALREAKLRSSWAAPDEAYEGVTRELLHRLLDPAASPEFITEIAAFVRHIAPPAEANSLVQSFLRYTCPGVPDLYQGCESSDLSLVDPDNRRPVDYGARHRSLGLGGDGSDARKQGLIARLLDLRRQHPLLFTEGSYEPIQVEGPRADRLLAFTRRHGDTALVATAMIRCSRDYLGSERLQAAFDGRWSGTRLHLPPDLEQRDATEPLGTGAPPFGSMPVYLRFYPSRK